MQLSGLSEHEIEALNKRVAKLGKSKHFEDTCRRVCAEFDAMKEACEECKSIVVEQWKRSVRRREGFLRRFLGWIRGILIKETKKTRRNIVRKQFFDDPVFSEQLLDDTNLNYVMLGIMRDTHPQRIVIMPGESEEDAVVRITQSHLQKHKEASKEAYFAEETSPPDKEWQADTNVGIIVDNQPLPEDPLLAYVKRSKLKEALAKESPDDTDRRIIDEALSKNDIVVLE